MDDDAFGLEDQPVCRICFDSAPSSPFVSPCACRGSQAYVHLACLRRWQSCVLEGKLSVSGQSAAEKAYRCGVCLTRYSCQPLHKSPARHLLSNTCRAVLAVLCLGLLVLSGGPQATTSSGWQHVILLSLLLLLGSRSQPMILLLLLTVVGTVGALYVRGLRLVCMHGGPGGSWGLAIIRSGWPVEHLGPGVLLVASRQLSSTMFKESVVLLLNHSNAHGAHGVLLTAPLTDAIPPPLGSAMYDLLLRGVGPEQLWGDIAARHSPDLELRRFLGGPVGLAPHVSPHEASPPANPTARGLLSWWPGPWPPAEEVIVLHNVPGVPGVCALKLPHNTTTPGSRDENPRHPQGPVVHVRGWTQPSQPGRAAATQGGSSGAGSAAPAQAPLWVGGSPSEVLLRATQLLSSGAKGAGGSSGGAGGGSGSGACECGVDTCPAAANGQLPAAAPEGKLRVLVFHGKASWMPGQLEGELRSGLWGVMGASPEVLHQAAHPPPPSAPSLWARLMASDDLTWL